MCVAAFLRGETRFTDIVPTIEAVLASSGVRSGVHDLTVEDVLAADEWARGEATAVLTGAARTRRTR